MTIPDRVWKWVAGVAVVALVFVLLWPFLTAGIRAENYLALCLKANACPSEELLRQRYQQLVQAPPPPAQTSAPQTPSPSPSPPVEKGK